MQTSLNTKAVWEMGAEIMWTSEGENDERREKIT
jgi:hypothetical protein